MPPSRPITAEKLVHVANFFYRSGTVHNLKELEQRLPALARISVIQVKPALDQLTVENQIRVERIGSINWYWAFPADLAIEKQAQLKAARKERDRLAAAVDAAKKCINDKLQRIKLEGDEKADLIVKLKEFEIVKLALETELVELDAPGELKRMERETRKLKEKTNQCVDNIFKLLGFYKEASGGNTEGLIAMRTMFGIEDDMDYED